jgi:hypothetical protein
VLLRRQPVAREVLPRQGAVPPQSTLTEEVLWSAMRRPVQARSVTSSLPEPCRRRPAPKAISDVAG